MAQICTVCTHEKRDEINEKLIKNQQGYSSIAREYDLNWQAVRSHHLGHIPKRMAKSIEKKEATEDLNMIKKCTELMQELETMISDYKEKGKDSLTLSAVDKLIKLYSTMASIASVYYQHKQDTFEQEQTQQEEQREESINQGLSKLNDQELEWFSWLSYKLGESEEHPGQPTGYQDRRRKRKNKHIDPGFNNENKDPISKYSEEENQAKNPLKLSKNEEKEPETEEEPKKKLKPYRKQIPSLATDDPGTKQRVRRELGMSNSGGVIGRK